MLTSSGEKEVDLNIKDFNNIGISTQSCQKQKSLHAFTIKLIELFFLEEYTFLCVKTLTTAMFSKHRLSCQNLINKRSEN